MRLVRSIAVLISSIGAPAPGIAGVLAFGIRMSLGAGSGRAQRNVLTEVGVLLAEVALKMVAVGLGACWLPALRAVKIDPAVAIRGR